MDGTDISQASMGSTLSAGGTSSRARILAQQRELMMKRRQEGMKAGTWAARTTCSSLDMKTAQYMLRIHGCVSFGHCLCYLCAHPDDCLWTRDAVQAWCVRWTARSALPWTRSTRRPSSSSPPPAWSTTTPTGDTPSLSHICHLPLMKQQISIHNPRRCGDSSRAT